MNDMPPDAPRAQSIIPVWDAVAFAHIMRVAEILAASSFLHSSLRVSSEGQPLPKESVIANAVVVANQASTWDMDPFGLAQQCSMADGRLVFEGKVIHGAIKKKLGVDLLYTTDGTGDDMMVTVSATLPGEMEPRTVTGTVGAWKTEHSAWSDPERQLRYRGAREWARAHAPGVILGVYGTDEIAALKDRRVPDRPAAAPVVTKTAPPPPTMASIMALTSVTQPDTHPDKSGQTEPAKEAAAQEAPPPPTALKGKGKKKSTQGAKKTAAASSGQPDIDPDNFDPEKFMRWVEEMCVSIKDKALLEDGVGLLIKRHRPDLGEDYYAKAQVKYLARRAELSR